MRKKIVLDVMASLLSSYVLAVWLDYNFIVNQFETEPLIYGVLLLIFLIIKILIFYKFRKEQSPPIPSLNKILDMIFPLFLIGIILTFIGMGIYIGDFSDEHVGQRIMESVSNDFTRNFMDIYAIGGQSAFILKPLGLLLFLVFTSVSRLLGAGLKTKNS